MKSWIVAAAILAVVMESSTLLLALPRLSMASGPYGLHVDGLGTPLGIDNRIPQFSWKLLDTMRGALQSAYEIQVATHPALLNADRPDIWDSGRTSSSTSLGIPYAGLALAPFMRYYWRVKLWNAAGKQYRPSAASWWETGLLDSSAWRAQWIGYETPEEMAVRSAGASWITNPESNSLINEEEERTAYRSRLSMARSVRSAVLYATGEDTVCAWVNGVQVLRCQPLPLWKRTPWKKYAHADVTAFVKAGSNTLAIEVLHYAAAYDTANTDDVPMIATLLVEYDDGTRASFVTGPDWRTSVHLSPGWQETSFDDHAWKAAALAKSPSSSIPEALGHPWESESVKALRRTFIIEREVRSARLYATALGLYEMFLNGRRVGDQLLTPGWTDYRKRVFYQTYDVTAMLRKGHNAVAALLAPGWYESPLEWYQQPNKYGVTPPSLRAQLRIEYDNGTVQWVTTDENWKAHVSSIVRAELYDGESADARLMPPSWNSVSFSDAGWQAAHLTNPPSLQIEAEDFQPIHAERVLHAVSIAQPKPGVYIEDFGQNFAGVEHLRVQGSAGTDVRLRFGEVLNPDGTLYTENLRTAEATDHFILNGHGVEEFTPQFTYHGFRYVEVSGLPAPPDRDTVTGVVIHTDAPFTAKLTTGSPMLNKLWANIQWGQRSNFISVPTDCPQRDERLGWMADAQVFWRAATYNMDLEAFSKKFAADMRGTQAGTPFFGVYAPGTTESYTGFAPGWSDAGVIIPWTSWLQTSDATIIKQNWDTMTKYVDAIASANPNGLWQNQVGIAFGDWLAPEGKTNQELIGTALWAYDTTLMAEMAHAIDRPLDEEKYEQMFEMIRAAFQKRFVEGDGFVKGGETGEKGKTIHEDTQTGYVLALHMHLLPKALRAAAARRLVNKIHANQDLLGTGFLGTPYLLEELTEAGYGTLAYTLLLNERYPSWGYMIDHGATTMWERWNGEQMRNDPSMNSYNHYAYGAVADWMCRYAAGIDTTRLDPGFRTIVLHPVFDSRVGHIALDFMSVFGLIHSDWTVTASGATWHITLPANTTGWIPMKDAARYTIDGMPLTSSAAVRMCPLDGHEGLSLRSGTYTFLVLLVR